MIQNKGDGVDENFKSDFLSDAELAKQKLDRGNYNWFRGLSEQYAAQKVFKEHGIKYGHLRLSDVGMGIEDFVVKCVWGKVVHRLRKKRTVAGYMSANYHLFLPDEYLEEYDLKRKYKHCNNND